MKLAKKFKKAKKGFTLIELIIVIAIIGILAAVAVPQFMDVQKNAAVAADKSSLKILQDALDQYNTTVGTYPTDNSTGDLYTSLKSYLKSYPIKYKDGSEVVTGVTSTPGGYSLTIAADKAAGATSGNYTTALTSTNSPSDVVVKQ